MAAGHVLPATTHPRAVRLQIRSLQASIHWYSATLGFQVVDASGDEVTLGTADGTPLVTLVERAGTRPIRPQSRLGLYHVAILLPSRGHLGALVRRLAALDVRVASADHLVSEALYLSDPDGLGLEVYADRPHDTWTWHDGHVVMTVDRLDLRNLARAATDPWDGLPVGTSVGHVHLHVGDLDQASAFYGADGLGFETTASLPGAQFLAAGRYHHHLGLNVWATGAPAPRPDDAQLLEWTLAVPDAAARDAARARLASTHAVTDDADGGWRASDPWGTTLRVVA